MKLFKVFRYDILYGLITQWKRALIVILLFSYIYLDFSFSMFHVFYFQLNGVFNLSPLSISLGDVLLITTGGNLPFELQSQNFQFPTIWFAVHLLMAYYTLSYAVEDVSRGGIQILIRAKSKKIWWISKCLWNISVIVSYYVLGYGTLVFWSAVTQKTLKFSIHPEWIQIFYGQVPQQITQSPGQLFEIFCLLPVLVSISLSLLQMAMTLWIKPIYAYVLTACQFVLGIYYAHSCILTNYAMPIRNERMGICDLQLSNGIGICIITCAVSFLAGLIFMKRRDLL